MQGDAFIFSNLYHDSQVTIMEGDVYMLPNSTLTFTSLLFSVLFELLFLSLRLLHCRHVHIDTVWRGCVGLLFFSLFGLYCLFWFFVVLYYRDSNLLECYALSNAKYLPTFRRCIVPFSLGSDSPLLLDCVTVVLKESSAHVRDGEILWPLPGIEPRANTKRGKTPL